MNKAILVIDYELPRYDLFAGSRTTFMYLRLFCEMGARVVFLGADFKRHEPYAAELENMGVEVLHGEWLKENWKRWVLENSGSLEYVFFNKPDPTSIFIDFLHDHTDIPLIYQVSDLHFLREQRRYEIEKKPELLDALRVYKEKEFRIFGKSDTVLTFSSYEKTFIEENFPGKKLFMVPLFIYDEKAPPGKNFKERRDLLFVGSFAHHPNADAVLWFIKEIFPRVKERIPDLKFNVVGAFATPEIESLASDDVILKGKLSDAELAALYGESRMAVLPLRYGAGLKGKLIEAMYFGLPIVSTGIGLEGLADIHALIPPKDTAEEFAAELINLYTSGSLDLTSARYRQYVHGRFSMENAKSVMSEVFLSAGDARRERWKIGLTGDPEKEVEPPRLIAIYLPQFHPIPENDKWWGKGFTEWTNVASAGPLFPGHYQPRLPGELGFYDLRLPQIREAQAALAREYGIYGFCYYHYWFNGKLLLERPLEEVLSSGRPDFPFCICWANEPWTKAWDGQDRDILLPQIYSEDDDRDHLRYLAPFMRDSRYIRVQGKPLLLIYRASHMPDPLRTTSVFREEAQRLGIGDIYLCRVESFPNEHTDPEQIGFDAALEFQPDWTNIGPPLKNPAYRENKVYKYEEVVRRMLLKEAPPHKRFPSVMPSWDNSPRRKGKTASIFMNSTPELYELWLTDTLRRTVHLGLDENFVFINAWNEWAEGNYIEPDQYYGRAYLEATRNSLKNFVASGKALQHPASGQAIRARVVQTAPAPSGAKEMHAAAPDRETSSEGQFFSYPAYQDICFEMENKIMHLRRKLLESENKHAADVKRLEDEIESQQKQLKDEIAGLMNSYSWRLTAPLRFIKSLASKLRK
jgi:glycosyltransferase involved in cell wall biosynthesis